MQYLYYTIKKIGEKKMKRILLLAIVISVLSACGKKIPNDARYSIEKGMITYLADLYGTKHIMYARFMDYGKKNMMETKQNNQIISRILNLGSERYMLDPVKKTGTKVIIPLGSPGDVNFLKLNDEAIKANNIKKSGNENVLGKSCEIYEMSDTKGGLSYKVWIWEGIMLKTEGAFRDMKYSYTASNIDLDATVEEAMFEVPNDYKIETIEMK